MLESKTSQFTLSPIGQILWQEKPNNPLPGEAIAVLKKGEHAMQPLISIIETELTQKEDANLLLGHLNGWLKNYMKETVEPLVLLEVPNGVEVKDDAVSKISAAVYNNLGIVSREDLEDVIGQLSPETRVDLRSKKIRLGPILVFIPSLNKPAAVKLRALLWSIFNGAPLPANIPADGVVSTPISDANACKYFYRSIGYPLFGLRAVRIDMLDRVISCVYDHAEKGKFQARHEMAEWLGCPIADLYSILEAMGHVKTHDPADDKLEEAVAVVKVEEPVLEKAADSETAKVEVSEGVDKPVPDESEEKKESGVSETIVAPVKSRPELATFRLKKGKAFQKSSSSSNTNKTFQNKDKKPAHKKHKAKPMKKKDNSPRVISVEAKKNAEDSPFAILQQLKK